jgi:hypothetical protein
MKKVLLAAAVVTTFATLSPVFANPSEEAEWGYAGWRAAHKANTTQPAETRGGHVIYWSNPTRH